MSFTLIGLFLKGIVGRVVAFLAGIPWAKVWWLIPIGISLGYGLYQTHERHLTETKLAVLQGSFTQEKQAFDAEHVAFEAEQGALKTARGIIDDNNRSILAAAADLDRAKQQAAIADVRNAKLAQSTDARIAALQAASRQHKAPCTLSDEAKRELENQ